jgi:hypothetical protein
MKSCSVCHRNFDDDTLLYCTEDGTPLSAPQRSGDATLLISSARDTDPPATEILPHGYQPPGAPNSATWPARLSGPALGSTQGQVPPTQAAGNAPLPMNYQPIAPAYQPASAPKRGSWIAVSVVLGLVALGAIVTLAVVLLRRDTGTGNANNAGIVTNNTSNNSSNNNSGGPATNTNVNGPVANTNTGDDGGEADWLYGEWEGSASGDGGSMSVRLIRDDEGTAITYSDCGGPWEQISMDADRARFTEKLTIGKQCESGATLDVSRTSADRIAVTWTYENTDIPVTTVNLDRIVSPQSK